MVFNVVVATLSLVFVAFLVLKELRRTDKSNRFWRIVTSIAMVASFVCIILPISYSAKREQQVNELNLLTEGTSIDTIQNLKSSKYDLDSTLFPTRKKLKIKHLANLTYHLRSHPEIKKINIYGYGLSKDELKMLKGYKISFHPATTPPGILSASWQKKLKASEHLTVRGIYANTTNALVKLILVGLGANLDSVIIKPHHKANFSFSRQPKQIGRAVFKVIAFKDKDTLSVNPIPFEVENKEPARILILASSPDFEIKFLKKWLHENQYAVAVRNKISKNKYSSEFLNRKAMNLNEVNQTLLKNIDVALCDEDELNADIFKAVQNGMGLIIRANKLPAKQDHQPLLHDDKGKVIADRRLRGMGKIVTTTAISTYEWELAGKRIDYAKFWTLLFEKSLRKKIEENTFEITPQWMSVNEVGKITLSVSTNKPPIAWINNSKIAPRQNMELPFLWDGVFWSKTPGWITISVNSRKENWYIYDKNDWGVAKINDKMEATANFANYYQDLELKNNKIDYLVNEEVSKWWFFFIFLITVSFLWYEQRFLLGK